MKTKTKIALAAPKIKLCDPSYNAEVCVSFAREADTSGADIILFPELTLTGATAGDLFFQERLVESAEMALAHYIEATRELSVMSFIGAPLFCDGLLYNAVFCISEGEILGISAKGKPSRQFSAMTGDFETTFLGRRTTVGRSLVYSDEETGASIFVKVGDDTAISTDNVNLILNPIAEPEYIGANDLRREILIATSAELGTSFAMACAGIGESGTDGIYSGARLVAQSGKIVAEAKPFCEDEIIYSEISLKQNKKKEVNYESFEEKLTSHPFIPSDDEKRRLAMELALEIQSRALALRIERSYSRCVVIGVSGGLDSTLALLVCARAMDILGRSHENIIAITMPCFGTTERTKGNALLLAEELSCTLRTIDIKAAVNQHFIDISQDAEKFDVVYENSQARERTQILMDVANKEGGLVVGTGDLSELALGFATYNGDHMSMYGVNSSVPKTLMREMINHFAAEYKKEGKERLSKVLYDVVNTPVSPELLPTKDGECDQHTESIVGPYELHDFFLYYTVKFGYSPSKILSLAKEVFEYSEEEIKTYLKVFVRRFFAQQFKRSCLPDGPRVTEISLSPRTSWQMPSDVSPSLWQSDIN